MLSRQFQQLLGGRDQNLTHVCSIIFVHGLTGGALRSWSADPSKPSWIEALLPEQVPNARILTFGYHADVIGSRVRALTIRNHASALLHDIEQEIQSQPNRRVSPTKRIW